MVLPKPLAFTLIALVAWAAIAGSCTNGPRPSRFELAYQRYLSLPHQRAFVIAGDPEGIWVGGYGYGYRSALKAQDRAMELCNVRKHRVGEDAKCVVYALGNKVVWKKPYEEE